MESRGEKGLKAFNQAFKDLKTIRTKILAASDIPDLHQQERKARQQLFALGFASHQLDYWIKEAVSSRYAELHDSAVQISDNLHEATEKPAKTPKATKATKATKKTKEEA